MLEMNVFVGLNKDPNGPRSKNDIRVQPDPAAAHCGDEILWRVHCLDPEVGQVEIDFGSTGDRFFQSENSGGDKPKCRKKLRGGRNGNQGNVWGVAPSLGEPGAKKNKYSIRAYDLSGATTLYEIDPTIVTVDP